MTEEQVKKSPKYEEMRGFGKVVELAAAYGLGDDGFMRTCENWGIACDREKAHKAVHEYYRPTHQKVVAYWYFLDAQMREAINNPGVTYEPFVVRRIAGINFLFHGLPSGRQMAYPHPEINRRQPTLKEKEEMAAGKNYPESRFLEVTYWGQLPQSSLWGRVKMHGARNLENRCQGIAADFMAHGAIQAEAKDMPPFTLIHDQALAVRTHNHTAEEFAAALADLPRWANGMPLKVEAKIAPYYSK
jgi:DNA polymerase